MRPRPGSYLALGPHPSKNQVRVLKNNFSCGVLRVSEYVGAKEGAHDDGSAIPEGIAVLLLPSGGSDSGDPPAPADRSLRRFQLRAGPAEGLLQPDGAPLD